MQAYRLETTIQQNGTLTLSNLPLPAGANIEVIILVQPMVTSEIGRYALRGQPLTYLRPLEPVAQSDWSVLP